MNYTEEQLTTVLTKHADWIEKFQDVRTTGVGIGQRNSLCIKVYGDEISAETKREIIDRLQGFPVEFAGEIRGRAY